MRRFVEKDNLAMPHLTNNLQKFSFSKFSFSNSQSSSQTMEVGIESILGSPSRSFSFSSSSSSPSFVLGEMVDLSDTVDGVASSFNTSARVLPLPVDPNTSSTRSDFLHTTRSSTLKYSMRCLGMAKADLSASARSPQSNSENASSTIPTNLSEYPT